MPPCGVATPPPHFQWSARHGTLHFANLRETFGHGRIDRNAHRRRHRRLPCGTAVRGKGFRLLGNIAVGIVGALVGGFLFGNVFIVGGLVGQIICATVGAVILLFVISLVT